MQFSFGLEGGEKDQNSPLFNSTSCSLVFLWCGQDSKLLIYVFDNIYHPVSSYNALFFSLFHPL